LGFWSERDGKPLAIALVGGTQLRKQAVGIQVDAAEYRAAYFLSPDLVGKRRLPIERDGVTLRLTIPRHRSASAVLLAKTGVHLALEGPAGAVVGQGADVTAAVDNWTDKPVAGRWTSPAWKDEPLEVRAGQSVRRVFRYQAPAKRGGLRETVTCRADVAGAVLGGDLEFYVDEPLSVSLVLPTRGEQGRKRNITAGAEHYRRLKIRDDFKAGVKRTGEFPGENGVSQRVKRPWQGPRINFGVREVRLLQSFSGHVVFFNQKKRFPAGGFKFPAHGQSRIKVSAGSA
jgi:hypothetical protein